MEHHTHRLFFLIEALTGSSSADFLASTSGYHSYEPSPFNHRLKRSSILDPSATEFHLETQSTFPTNTRSSTDRRSSRTSNQTPLRFSTSCKYKIKIFSKVKILFRLHR